MRGSDHTRPCSRLFCALLLALAGGCEDFPQLPWLTDKPAPDEPTAPPPAEPTPTGAADAGTRPDADAGTPRQLEMVPLWKNGQTSEKVEADSADLHGYLVLDLGEAWVPYIFTDGFNPEGELETHDYRSVYLALARGEYPDSYHGERAKDDKYLELYGILPTLALLRERFARTRDLDCIKKLDLQPLVDFEGFLAYRSNDEATKQAKDFVYLRTMVKRMMKKQRVTAPEEIDKEKLDWREKDRLKRYWKGVGSYQAVAAAQKRLKCEGYYRGKRRFTTGALDWATHEALAEFERRHRVYGWGYLGSGTLRMLRMSPLEAEREGILRVLTERAMLAAAVIEDGSTSQRANGEPRTYQGADGKAHPIPNLEQQLRQAVVDAFGLRTPESTFAWLESLGTLDPEGHYRVAIKAPPMPDYYDGEMDLLLEYDRGDVWYDFPYDEQGKQLAQPVRRRPRITVSVKYNDQKIPLARLGTTIGGWRSEQIDEQNVVWKYKGSPPGWRAWRRIISAPVWLPPDTTPPRDVLKRKRKRKPGEPPYEINYHEMGPSYASAYGLVAAYHEKYFRNAEGEIRVGGDEGIRTHGSVDYMSIMRRHSHGCHRLHNHIAVRLMCFVLAHRPHRRLGHQPLSFKKEIVYEEVTYNLDLLRGGYIFELERPLEINVLEGNIKGKLKKPLEIFVPKFNEEVGAYLMPDGGAVVVREGQLQFVPVPVSPDAGVDAGPAAAATGTATRTVPVTTGQPAATAPKPAAP